MAKPITWLLVEGSRGQYVPRFFAQLYGEKHLRHVASVLKDKTLTEFNPWHMPKGCEEVLLAGPDHEHYWEVWDQCLSSCYLDAAHATKRMVLLYEGADLFAVEDEDGPE